MLMARLLGILLLVALGVMLIVFTVTGDRKWLRVFGRTLQIGILIGLIFIGIYFLQRFLLVT
jgi:xanthine/uracil/vitamin C permease (AzgA family)